MENIFLLFFFFNRPDTQLRTIVYKLVSGLYNIEQQRIEKYSQDQSDDTQLSGFSEEVNKDINASKITETVIKDVAAEKIDSAIEFYYSPDDPIR